MVGISRTHPFSRLVTWRRRRLLPLLVLLLGATAGLQAGPAATKPLNALDNCRLFTVGGGGSAGQTSDEETQFRLLLQGKNAEKDCQLLVRRATPEGQLYGLLGLKILKSGSYTETYETFKNSERLALTDSGGKREEEPMREIAERINQGKYQ